MPPVKLPFHFSYLLYIGTFSATLAVLYFKSALRMCQLSGTEPSLLLHPLDFLGGDDVSELAFFPAMKMAGAQKLALMDRILRILSSRYSVLQLGAHAGELLKMSHLKVRSPNDLDR